MKDRRKKPPRVDALVLLRHSAFRLRRLQNKVVAAQNDGMPPGFAEFINHGRQPGAGVLPLRRDIERQFAAKAAVIDIGEFQRHQAQTHAPFPSRAQHGAQPAIHVRFKVGRLAEAFVHLVFRHVVVADSDRQSADAPAFLAHLCKKIVRHAPQSGFDILLVGHVGRKGLLLAERLLRLAHGNQRALVNPVRELPDGRRLDCRAATPAFPAASRRYGGFAQVRRH